MANKVITVTDPSVVTNDTLAGYNNYSDIDGQLGTTMTPTEATNGKTVTLSDGVVHEVTTKPVGTTNGEFSAVVSSAVTVDLSGGGYIFYEDFADALNITTDWDFVNDDASTIFGAPSGNEMEVIAGTTVTSYRDNYYISQLSANVSATEDAYCCFDIDSVQQRFAGVSLGLLSSLGTRNGTRITLEGAADGNRYYSYVADSLVNDSTVLSGLDCTTTKTVKMAITNNGANFDAWYWNGSSWTSLYSISGLTTFTASVKIIIAASGSTSYVDPYNVSQYYLTDTDFSTQYPS